MSSSIRDIKITKATEDNWNEISNLLVDNDLATCFTGKESYKDFFIAQGKNKDEILCAFSIVTSGDLGILKSMAVPKELQGQGIGKLVCSKIPDLCKELKIKKLFAACFKPVHVFWRKTFFQEITYDEIDEKYFLDYLANFKDEIEDYFELSHFFVKNF